MPRSGGVFSLVPAYLATPGDTIRAEQHNLPLEDIANGLTGSLPRDGSAPMTGNLDMGGRRITGLPVPTGLSDAVRLEDLQTTATTEAAGQVELATNAETITGTDNTRAVTPAGLKAAINDVLATGFGNAWLVGNWNTLTGSGFVVGQDAPNGPVGGATFTGWASQEGANAMTVLVVRAGSNQVWGRRKVSGSWEAWFQIQTV